MDAPLALLITTIGHTVSAVIVLIAGVLVLLHNRRRTVNILFAVSAFSSAVFGLGLAVAINLDPSSFAYGVWMLNLVDIFIAAPFAHYMLILLGREKSWRWFIASLYAVGFFILISAVLAPQLFIPEVTPKLFTKSYLNAGPLYALMFVYFGVVMVTMLVLQIRTYFLEQQYKKQVEYFIFATAIGGLLVGPIDFLLVFDIPISPLFGMFYGLYMVPIAYGIVASDLLDIRIAFKRALIYSVIIGVVTGFLMLLISLNNFLASQVAWVQWWTTPIATALVAVFIGRLFWLNSVENERLKYEFITVAAHKLRTPLTQISWGVRELLDKAQDAGTKELAQHIQHSANRLIELTNIIFETTQDTTGEYTYESKKVDLNAITKTVIEQLSSITSQKNIMLTYTPLDHAVVLGDERRIRSVIEVLIENALNYTPQGGAVTVALSEEGRRIMYSVSDTGIGVSDDDKKRIFTKFYRSDEAKRVDTEGVGLGLAMAKNIIEKHKGKISVESAGEGKGARFSFTLPKA